MIQTPQVPYIPAQQPTQPVQPAAYTPVSYNQPQTPGVIYNYPTASSYMPAQPYTGQKSQFNGVNIEIINPQGQAGVPQTGYQMPAQYMPVQQPVMMPQYPYYPAQPVYPGQPAAAPVGQPQVPAPQVAPATPVVDNPATVNPAVNPETFAGRLATSDLDAQSKAIEELASKVKESNPESNALLDTQIFDALINIINKDNSSLEGPSPEVIELRQKAPEQLTPEEKEKASTPSPLEKAEMNKLHSLYTIAYMQQRLNDELVKRNGSALELKDLPGIETVIETVKSNPNPVLRVGGIASLIHINRPEYKTDLATIFELAKSDEDPTVQETAKKAAEDLNS